MFVYHVSTCPSDEPVKEFIPRIPWSIGPDEDIETPRICVSSNLTGALTAAILSDQIINEGEPFMVYYAAVAESDLIPPEILMGKFSVLDAMYTREYWVTKPVVMQGRKYRITGYERDNYILPVAEDEAAIRSYLKSFIGYDERMSLHTLFNKFVQYAGVDEDDLAERFQLRGIRGFSKIFLEKI